MKVAAVFALGLGLGTAGPVSAQTTPTMVSQAIGNRLEVVYPGGGPTVTFDLEADGTFTGLFPGGVRGRGDYVADHRHVCFIVKQPVADVAGENVRCERNSTEGRTVGQSWTVVDSHGDTVTITVKPRS